MIKIYFMQKHEQKTIKIVYINHQQFCTEAIAMDSNYRLWKLLQVVYAMLSFEN